MNISVVYEFTFLFLLLHKYSNKMKQNQYKNLLIITVLVLAAALLRIINREAGWWHFAPMVAMSLFAGATLKRSPLAYILPLISFLLTDIYMQAVHHDGFYGISQGFVYGGMLAVVLLGSFMKKKNVLNVLGFSVGSSLLFWVISNFGVFMTGYWGTGFEGLVQTYAMALPFYKSELGTNLFLSALFADIIFSGVIFAAYHFLTNNAAARQQLAK